MSELQPWQLETPAGDGEVLLWPRPARWVDLLRESAGRLDTEAVRLIDLPLGRARHRAREGLRLLAGDRPDAGVPWIATGHQTFPYHPGIWVKNVAVDAVAKAAGGAALNINVDHDLPHAGDQLAWPALDADGRLVRRGALPLDGQSPFERQPAPAADRLAEVCRELAGDLAPLGVELGECPFRDAPAADAFGHWFALTRAAGDRRLGLRLAETLSSELDESDAFLLFAADLMRRAGEVHGAYNAALADARVATGHHIAPDLAADGEVLEMPFWTLRADTPGRHRLMVRCGGPLLVCDDIGVLGEAPAESLRTAEGAICALRRVLTSSGACLRPRALTLTLFARLLLADLFVHGIGGGRYDVATDGLFLSLYGLRPPYAVASGTLLLPLDVATATADQLRRQRALLRDMRFNPDRHLPAATLRHEPAAALLAAKRSAIERNQALRNATTPPSDAPPDARPRERAQLFRRIREINRDLAALMEDALAEQRQLVQQLAEQTEAGEVADARDYYYALQPADRLADLAGRVRDRFA